MDAVKPKNEITLGQTRILLNGLLEQGFRAQPEANAKVCNALQLRMQGICPANRFYERNGTSRSKTRAKSGF